MAKFDYNRLLCDNEIITTTNQSFLPAQATGDIIDKWHWQVDVNSFSSKEPSLNLSSGVHNVKLVVETNYGCKSTSADSLLTIFPKPEIEVDINDSCVHRTINYTAIDISNSVNKWLWNFGNTYREYGSSIIRSYTKEGDQSFSLIGKTIYGCQDTVIRPFRIYDNKAFAGRDTIAAIDQPVQLNANGGLNNTYLWSPALGLNDPTIENPIAVLDRDLLYTLDALTKEGCDSHSKILIRRFKGPELYIPSAFTPNGDTRNEMLKVFPVGIKAFHYFAVYDRWGELLFKTSNYNHGWDGNYKGRQMPSGTFVAIAEAVDYRGKKMMKKLLVTLIR